MTFTLADLRGLVAYKNELIYIFGASGYRGTNHLASFIRRPADALTPIAERQRQIAVLAVMGLMI